MRRGFILALLVSLALVAAGRSYGESTGDRDLKQWRREVIRPCPAKHLESASISKMNGLVEILDLSPSEQIKVAKIEEDINRNLCGGTGLGCSEDAYIYAIQKIGKLRELVKKQCEYAPMCRSASDCD